VKTAVFYDLENIGFTYKSATFEKDFLFLQNNIKKSDFVGEIILQRAYMRKNEHVPFIESVLTQHKVELVLVEPVSNTSKKKTNLVDFKMGIDVTATVLRKRSVETVAVASGDSDFGFLCQQIKEMGKNLLIISNFNITGNILLDICDDWVSVKKQKIKPGVIESTINTRLIIEYKDVEFFEAFSSFLGAMASDPFVRHCMREFGLPLPMFVSILKKHGIALPKYQELGFINITALVSVLLQKTGYECRYEKIYLLSKKELSSQENLLDSIISKPHNYSREKMLHYYDVLSQADSINELMEYAELMKRLGMIKQNDLCYKRTFRASIRKHIRGLFEKANIDLDEDALKSIISKL